MTEHQPAAGTAVAVVIEQRIVAGREAGMVTVDLLLDVLPRGQDPFRATVRATLPVTRVRWIRPGAQVLVAIGADDPPTLGLAAVHALQE